jgi:N utilization substance protein B
MVSRRSVRIKVMQLLYSQSRDEQLSKSQLVKAYDQSVEKSFELLMFTLYIFIHASRCAVDDEQKRKSKYLPTEEDARFSARLYENSLMQSLAKSPDLVKAFKQFKFETKADSDFCQRQYNEFAKTPEYKAYIAAPSTPEADLEILLELFRFLRKDEYFNEVVEDHFANWFDDQSLVIGAMKKIIKALPVEGSFLDEHYPDKETAEEFGKTLLQKVTQNEEEIRNLVEPTLKNWDPERVAVIDMILLEMAVAEFLYFPTIPTKVTLNEYVEVSKLYSTPKSKDFINGILDRLMKSLKTEGKIQKEGRGLLD